MVVFIIGLGSVDTMKLVAFFWHLSRFLINKSVIGHIKGSAQVFRIWEGSPSGPGALEVLMCLVC